MKNMFTIHSSCHEQDIHDCIFIFIFLSCDSQVILWTTAFLRHQAPCRLSMSFAVNWLMLFTLSRNYLKVYLYFIMLVNFANAHHFLTYPQSCPDFSVFPVIYFFFLFLFLSGTIRNPTTTCLFIPTHHFVFHNGCEFKKIL